VLADELQDLRVDRRPDRLLRRLAAGAEDVLHVGPLPRFPHVLEWHDHLEVELFARARVDEPDGARAGDEAADLVHRALGRREADPLEGRLVQRFQTFDRQRHV
jgi:hypothetical protein